MEPTVAISTPARPLRRATLAEWLAEPEEKGAELLRGRIVYKAEPSFDHGRGQRKLGVAVDPYDRRPGEGGRPGGWWLATETDIELDGEGVRPDLAGWRRDRIPARPKARPGGAIAERPDWVAEILSPSTASRDLGEKLATYHRAGIPHYWIVDPTNQTLTVHRWSPDGYLVVLGAGKDEVLRAEPFDAIELRVGLLFGDDDRDTQSDLPEAP